MTAFGVEPPVELRITVDPQPIGLALAGVLVTAESVDDSRDLLSAPLLDGRRVRLGVPRRGNWIVSCQGEGFWCPRLEIGAYDALTEKTLPVFQSARAIGKLETPRGRPAPEKLTVQGRVDPEGKAIELVETVDVSRGRFTLSLPRQTMDLRSSSPGWAPHYWWSLDTRRALVDLGTVVLRHGSSVSGLTVNADTGSLEAGVRVTLEQKSDLDPAKRTRLQAVSFAAITDAQGFFQITGLDPSRYQLTVRRGAEPETFVDVVDVPPETEVFLGRVLRRRPVDVTFEVRPAQDGGGEPWRVVLRPLTQRTPGNSEPQILRTDTQGIAEIEDLRPDSYEILVIDSRDARLFRTEADLNVDAHLALEVPIVAIEGTVFLGNRPLSASITLHGMESDSADFTSDTDGRFSGWMRRPSGAAIMARIESVQPRVDRRVRVKDLREEGGKLNVEIRLEDLAIRGRVEDETGRPLRASVMAESLLERLSAQAGDAGDFEMRGLAGGRYQVVARRGDRPEMSPIEVDLSQDVPSREVVLVMSSGRVLEGRVLSAEGQPVPGAGILLDVLGYAPADKYASTDLDGSFRMRVPEDAVSAHLTVLSEALPLLARCVSLPVEEELTIKLAPQPSADVELYVPSESEGRDLATPGRWVLFSQEGGVFQVDQLANWQFQQAGRMHSTAPSGSDSMRLLAHVTGLPSGSYALAPLSLPWAALVAQTCTAGPQGALAWTPVLGGGTAILRLGDR